ncbi:MAG: hypothetical protein ABSH05_19775 [Bryobacteraceae bacterium]|jgi:4-amino-4-deoxy-L-arabinose transferase-like glycosyltransferase
MKPRAVKPRPAGRTVPEGRSLVPFALAALVAIGALLRVLSFLEGVPVRSPDEYVYTDYASRIVDRGPGVIPKLVAEYESKPVDWVFPPPTRIGYVSLVAVAMQVSGVRDFSVGAAVSCLFSCLSLVLVAWFGWRFFNPWIALSAATFLGVSVGELGMAVRAWQDATFGFLGLLLAYLACEITRSPRRLRWYLAFLAAGAYSLLTKETGFIVYGLCAAWVLGVLLVKERSWKAAALLVLGGVASLAGAALVWSAVCGGLRPVLSVLGHAARSRNSDWTVQHCSGPWYQFPYLLWIVGPATAALALVGTLVPALRRRLLSRAEREGGIADWRAAGVAALIAVGFVALASFGPSFQYLRIISPADGAYCLLAGLGLWYLLWLARRGVPASGHRALLVLITVAVAISAARDYRTFRSLTGAGDLAVRFVREALQR